MDDKQKQSKLTASARSGALAGHISNLRSSKALPSQQLAEALDRHLGVGGTLAATAARSGRQRGRATRSNGPTRVVEALRVAMSGDGDLSLAALASLLT